MPEDERKNTFPCYATVRLSGLPYTADKAYDYGVPEALAEKISVGSLVLVPFGGGQSAKRAAIVLSLSDRTDCEEDKIKPILSVADARFSLNAELLSLCTFLHDRTFCSFGEAAETILPAGALSALFRVKRDPIERSYRLTADLSGVRLGAAEKRVAEALGTDWKTAEELAREAKASQTTLKNMVEKGWLSLRTREVYRNPYAGRGRVNDPNDLSREQQKACDELVSLTRTGKPEAALLWGVTGSGKTRVVKALIDEVLRAGKSAILLVPEISLTGQTVDLFCGYFGERVAVIHSGLSEGERLDAWKRIRAKEVDVVIGTRSAIFAPLDNLGLIVMDEEQEHTYKSDMNPKYHTKDVARFRAMKQNALMLLVSATPSLESYFRAEEKVYHLSTLTERYGDSVLPEVIIADLREDCAKGKITPIGGRLGTEIEKNLKAGEQTLLFVGRRGYHHFVSCKKCGEVITCPNCSVSLTYHREHDSELLKCHYCGFTRSVPDVCEKCGSEHLGRQGFGTQLVAEELHEAYPDARILRMDADAVGSRFSHDAILSSFRNHEADILIGTQMVTKGHNFPDVTLVGVINADSALFLDDFRATEKTFDLLTQVIGRAGRADKPGRAVIQTYAPENDTIAFAAKQDYPGFYHSAIALRKQLLFPPFSDFVLFGITGEDEPAVLELSLQVDQTLRGLLAGEFSDLSCYVFGPFEAPVYKVNHVYRMRVIVKCRVDKRMRELISRLLSEYKKTGKASLGVDINPASL